MKTTKTSKGAIALLAAATAAILLGSGLPASAAPSTPPTPPSGLTVVPTDSPTAAGDRITGKIVLPYKYLYAKWDGRYYMALSVLHTPTPTDELRGNTLTTSPEAAAALPEADTFTLPQFGSRGTIEWQGKCADPVIFQTVNTYKFVACDGSAKQQFTISWDGVISQPQLGRPGHYYFGGDYRHALTLTSDEGDLGIATPGLNPYSFRASVSSVDKAGSTALITGTAKPGAEVKTDNVRTFADDDTGEWTLREPGLRVGTNVVRLVATDLDTGRTVGQTDLALDLTVRPLTAEALFYPDKTVGVVFKGWAEPEATITVTDPKKTPTHTTADASGAWSIDVPGPGLAGKQDFSVAQTVYAERFEPVTVTVDYGRAVTIDGPEDGAAFAGGSLEVFGVGQSGSAIRLFDNGVPAGTTTVRKGKFSATLTGLDATEHVITVEQLSKGANTTTASVTVNPGGVVTPPDETPFEVVSPKVEDGYTPGLATTFTGTANPGSTVSVTNKWGTSLGRDVTADAKGDWSFTRVMTGTSVYHIVFTETTTAGATNTVNFFDFGPVTPATPVFDVISPRVEDGYTPGAKTTFTGTAHPGAVISVTNKWGVSLGANVKANAQGAWTFTRVMTGTSTYQMHFVETYAGTTTTLQFYGFAPKK